MAYASQSGFARTDPSNPQAHAICDRCGFRYNWVDLKWQMDWRGAALQNLRILVCSDCYDTPQEQLRAIVLPADPDPIINARVESFADAETDYLTASAPVTYDPKTYIPVYPTTTILTQNGQNLTTQPIGPPIGMQQGAMMPLINSVVYDTPIPYLSIISTGTNIITVTCSSPHGLSTNSQISVLGLSQAGANGFYSVTVGGSQTQFTYSTNRNVPSGSLATSTTRMLTASVGIPYNYNQIPQTGN
jgi:hypothetical protein